MIFGQDRNALREMYRQAWNKAQNNLPVSPLEAQIVDVLQEHPEYQKMLTSALDQDYSPESGQTNPYLHLSLHLAVRDQVKTNRPPGIATLFQQLCQQCGDVHAAEHQLCEQMGEELWHSQRNGTPPDEQRYLAKVRGLIQGKSR